VLNETKATAIRIANILEDHSRLNERLAQYDLRPVESDALRVAIAQRHHARFYDRPWGRLRAACGVVKKTRLTLLQALLIEALAVESADEFSEIITKKSTNKEKYAFAFKKVLYDFEQGIISPILGDRIMVSDYMTVNKKSLQDARLTCANLARFRPTQKTG
jgi:hypothetical protein